MTFYAVEKSLSLIEGFIEVKYNYGKHKKGWKSRYVALHSSDKMGQSARSGTLIVSDRNVYENKNFIFVTDVTIIRRVHYRRRGYAFLTEFKDGDQVYLNGPSESQIQKWMCVFRSVFLGLKGPSFIAGYQENNFTHVDQPDRINDHCNTKGSFPAVIIDNQDSNELGVNAYCILEVSVTSLSLVDLNTNTKLQQWPLNQIERFLIPTTCSEDINRTFTFDVVRNGTKKTYLFCVEDAMKILDLVKYVILENFKPTSKVTVDNAEKSNTIQSQSPALCGVLGATKNSEDVPRKRSSALLRKNAMRSRTYTSCGFSALKKESRSDRRVLSMNDVASEGFDYNQDMRTAKILSPYTKGAIRRTDSPSRSQFYVVLNETNDKIKAENANKKQDSSSYSNLCTDDVGSISNDIEGINSMHRVITVSHSRGQSLPETEWIVPEGITIPKKSRNTETNSNLLDNGHLVARRRISTNSNIYYDLETLASCDTMDDTTPLTKTKLEADRYKKNLNKFLGIPEELKDPLSAPPALPTRPKSLPQTAKKTTNDGRYSLKDAVFQTLKRNRRKDNSESIAEGNSSDDNSELDYARMPLSATNVVPISSWPLGSQKIEYMRGKKVEKENHLYNITPNIYMNEKPHACVDRKQSETDHIYALVSENDDNIDLKLCAKSLDDILQEIQSEDDNDGARLHKADSKDSLGSKPFSIYENVPWQNLQHSRSSCDLSDQSIHALASSSLDSLYFSMDQLHVKSIKRSFPEIRGNLSSNNKADSTDNENIYMAMGPKGNLPTNETESIYENYEFSIID